VRKQERNKIKIEKKKYYLYRELRLLTLSCTSWIELIGFKNINPHSIYDIYLLVFFNPLSSIISILFNFDGSSKVGIDNANIIYDQSYLNTPNYKPIFLNTRNYMLQIMNLLLHVGLVDV
jgi:hypothetical protein